MNPPFFKEGHGGGRSISFFRHPRPDVERERNDQDNDDGNNKSDRQLHYIISLIRYLSLNSPLILPF